MLLVGAGSILWGRFVFSVDFDVTGLSPEDMTVPVTCHVSWGADKAVVAHEELTGTFELLQVAHELVWLTSWCGSRAGVAHELVWLTGWCGSRAGVAHEDVGQ